MAQGHERAIINATLLGSIPVQQNKLFTLSRFDNEALSSATQHAMHGKLTIGSQFLSTYPAMCGMQRKTIRTLFDTQVDIFSHSLLIIPVHLGVHWCLSVVDFRRKRVDYLDSMGSPNQAALDAILQYLRDEHQDKKGTPFDDNGWITKNLKVCNNN